MSKRYIPKQTFISRALSKLSFTQEKKDAHLPWSKASSDMSTIANADSTHYHSTEGKKQLRILYGNSWPIFKALNVRANLLSSRGLKIVTKSDKAKKAVNEMLKQMHPTRPMLALQNTFRDRSINTDLWGNSFDELLALGKDKKPLALSSPLTTAKSFAGFSAIDPRNIDFQRAENSTRIKYKDGVPVGYKFKYDPESDFEDDSKDIPLDRVAHLKYNKIGDELLGISTVEPAFKTAERLMKIEEGVTQGILTHGNPLHDIIVGDESHIPTKEMIDNVSAEVAGLNTMSEYVHPPWIRVGQIESFSLGKSPNYMQPFITAIAACTSVPEFILLGRGEGTNKATAQAMIDFVHQTIEPLQQAQAMYFEESILAPAMEIAKVDEVPTIEWNDILPKSVTDYANVIKTLSEAMIGGKQIISMEEAREMAGLGDDIAFKEKSGSNLAEQVGMPAINLETQGGKLIWEGKKSMILKSKDFTDMTMKPIYLISDNKIYGTIKLRAPEKINLEQFDDLYKQHKISESQRQDLWPEKETLYAYTFNKLEMFDKPVEYQTQKEVKDFIKSVQL